MVVFVDHFKMMIKTAAKVKNSLLFCCVMRKIGICSKLFKTYKSNDPYSEGKKAKAMPMPICHAQNSLSRLTFSHTSFKTRKRVN